MNTTLRHLLLVMGMISLLCARGPDSGGTSGDGIGGSGIRNTDVIY